MKSYENANRATLIKRMPVIIRLDGKAFHTYTVPLKAQMKGTYYPYHQKLHWVMSETMRYLCENVQNVVFGYVQSDEISLLLKDWETFESQQWFGGLKSKIESISASMATGKFNRCVHVDKLLEDIRADFAMFDSRAYNVPREDVTNYFVWRQKDAIRNSIQMLGQHYYSQNALNGKSVLDIQQMMMKEYSIDWSKLPVWAQHGTAWTKTKDSFLPPVFSDNRDLIESLIYDTKEVV